MKHTYTLDGTKILKEVWGENVLVPLYDTEETVCGIIYNNTPFYFQKNLQGDVISITNASGTSVARYNYDAWGACEIANDTSGCNIATINPYRYRGYYYDDEIHMYYLQSRYYDPVVGRFVGCDIIESVASSQKVLDANVYSYCENNPINNHDSNGAISWKKILSVFDRIGNVAKQILEYIIDSASLILGIKSKLNWKTISKIAKEIKRSPHRVRQWFNWLEKELKCLKSKTGKIFKALSFILFFTSIINVLGNVKEFINEIATKLFNGIAEGLASLISWGVSKGIKFFSKFVPALGGVLGFLLGEAIGRVLDIFFESYSTLIANRYASKVDIYSFKFGDYFITFFSCLF